MAALIALRRAIVAEQSASCVRIADKKLQDDPQVRCDEGDHAAIVSRGMNEFRTEKRVPSTRVDKELLARLEELLYDLVHKSGLANRKGTKLSRHILIEDAFGQETVSTVVDLSRNRFSDSTKKIQLHISLKNDETDSIDVVFSVQREETRYLIRLSGADARDKCLVISEAIESLIRERGALGAFVGQPAAMGVFLAFFAVSIAVDSLDFDRASEIAFQAGLVLGILIGAARYLWPYTEFDTPRLDLLRHGRKIGLWILGTLIAAWIGIRIQPFL